MLQGVVDKDMTAKENADKGAFSNHETVKSDKILRLELLFEMRRLETDGMRSGRKTFRQGAAKRTGKGEI